MLKKKLAEAHDELDIAHNNINKLEQRLMTETEDNEKLMYACQHQKAENEKLKESMHAYEYEIESIKNSLKVLKGELDR